MAFCSKCGYNVEVGVSYCPKCGAPIQQDATNTQNTNNSTNQFVNLNKTNDFSNDFDANDVQSNKVQAILAYFGILVLVPILGAKDSKYAKFHANQGLILLIISIMFSIVISILSSIFVSSFLFSGAFNIFYYLIKSLYVVYLGIGLLAILGIVNAATGKAKELPLIVSIRILK